MGLSQRRLVLRLEQRELVRLFNNQKAQDTFQVSESQQHVLLRPHEPSLSKRRAERPMDSSDMPEGTSALSESASKDNKERRRRRKTLPSKQHEANTAPCQPERTPSAGHLLFHR